MGTNKSLHPQPTKLPTKPSDTLARLNCRISGAIKDRAEAAATLMGQTLTGFTEAALADKAQVVLERQERIVLSEQDFAHFVALVNDPPAPTSPLAAAMEQYRRLQAAYPESNL